MGALTVRTPSERLALTRCGSMSAGRVVRNSKRPVRRARRRRLPSLRLSDLAGDDQLVVVDVDVDVILVHAGQFDLDQVRVVGFADVGPGRPGRGQGRVKARSRTPCSSAALRLDSSNHGTGQPRDIARAAAGRKLCHRGTSCDSDQGAWGTCLDDRRCPGTASGASPDRLVVCAPGPRRRARDCRTTHLDEVPERPDGQAVSNAIAIPAISPSGGRAEEAHHDHLALIGCGRRPGRAD